MRRPHTLRSQQRPSAAPVFRPHLRRRLSETLLAMQTSLRPSARPGLGLKSASAPKALRPVKVPCAVRVMASSVSTASPAATVEVELGDRTYPIYIGSGLLAGGELLRKHLSLIHI